MVVFRLARDYRLMQKRLGHFIRFAEQTLAQVAIERIADDEETVFLKRVTLLGSERYKIHHSTLPNHATVLHLLVCRRQNRSQRKQRTHVLDGVERVISALPLRF